MKHRMQGWYGLVAACGLAAVAVAWPRMGQGQETKASPPAAVCTAAKAATCEAKSTCEGACKTACSSVCESACESACVLAGEPGFEAACARASAVAEHPVACPLGLSAEHVHRVIINDKGAVTVFVTKLPAIGQMVDQACHGPSSCEELLARLGRELNIQASAACGKETCAGGGKCLYTSSPDGDATAVSHTADCQCCQCRDAAALAEVSHTTKAAACAGSGACNAEAKCGGEGCHEETAEVAHEVESLPPHHPLLLIQHIAGLVADKAAAEAALETQEASFEKQTGLYETVAELMAANAAMQSKLEAQCDQAQLAEKLADLAAENARLKAHVELAAERAELTRGALSLSIENERLKLRLAELEQRHAAEEAARTAERSRGNRKPR